jgi:hypothetical protein
VSHDEVLRGSGGGGGAAGWVLILCVAVVVALFSLLTHHGKPAGTPTAPLPLPSQTPSAPASAVPSAAPSAGPSVPGTVPISLNATEAILQQAAGFVSAQDICPASTNRRTTLNVSAVIHNDTTLPEEIEALTPALPLGGLKTTGVSLRSGTCSHPVGKPASPLHHVLEPGATALVTLHFTLPRTCPQPLPVELDVTLSITGDVRSEQLRLFNDLGGVTFDSCPSPSAG